MLVGCTNIRNLKVFRFQYQQGTFEAWWTIIVDLAASILELSMRKKVGHVLSVVRIRRFALALKMLGHYGELYRSPLILFETIAKRRLIKPSGVGE